MSFIDEFQEQVWKDKYQYKNETYEEFCERIAYNIFRDDTIKSERLKNSIMEFRVIFGGRINSNIGIEESGLTLFNCFIESTVKHPDSLEGILDAATKYAITLKTEGGVGFCANYFRPEHTIIRKIGVTTPGSVKFLEIFDKISEVITSGNVSKDDSVQGIPTKNAIRKGATMVTLDIRHPDIETFITAKSKPNKLTKMNMSVLITDKFMYAVENDSDWELWFPDINFEKYDDEWNGDFDKWEKNNYPKIIYKTIKAKYLWNLLLSNSYNRNEPGILFIDTIRKMDNLGYLDSKILSTNPCGEVVGNTGNIIHKGIEYELGDVCNLGSFNLPRYYSMITKRFNYDLFIEDIYLMVEALDNVIDISRYPLPMYEHAAKMKRKIGLGLSGLGSLFFMMGIRYGSEESISFIEHILLIFMNTAYKASSLLAKEKGAFELYNEKLLDGGYVKHSDVLTEDTLALIKKYGLRNSSLAAIAPNGTLSIIAGIVSGGIEPVFSSEILRWYRLEGKTMNFKYPRTSKGEWFETDYFKEKMIADEQVLMSIDGNYRIDKNQGLCKKYIIKDYGYKLGLEYGLTEFSCATELSIDEHFNILKVYAKYIDLSCSKTLNLPSNISFDEFKNLYNKIYSHGIKGCTTYRQGTTIAVLESNKPIKVQQKQFLDIFKDHNSDKIIHDVIKLPEEYPSKGYVIRAEKAKWYIHVAFKDEEKTRPFAIFVTTNDHSPTLLTINTIDELKNVAIRHGLGNDKLYDVERKFNNQENHMKIARMLGYLFRHNVPMIDIIKALENVKDAHIGTFVFRIKKFLLKFVPKSDIDTGNECPVCGGKDIIFQEGCFICENCMYSKCG